MSDYLADPNKPQSATCPKRNWVLDVLTDDADKVESLPQGLQFHLSRCESCRALATRLEQAVSRVSALAAEEPSEFLRQSAEQRTIWAIENGAQLTGRVRIAESDETPTLNSANSLLRRLQPFTLAACIGIVALLVTLALRNAELPTTAVTFPPQASVHPVSHTRDAANPSTNEKPRSEFFVGPSEKLASADGESAAPRGLVHNRGVPKRFTSHIDAAMSDDPFAIPHAIVLPDTSHRDLGWARWFDNSPRVLSTGPSKNPP